MTETTTTTTTTTHPGPSIRNCSPHEAFNLPLFEYYLVLDTRPAKETGPTLAGAHRLPEGKDYAKDVQEFLDMLEENLLWPEQWKTILIYDDGDISDYTKKVAESVRQALVKGANTPTHDRSNLFATVEEIWLLEGGYSGFELAYPQLCGVSVEELTPSPCLITPFVFMASRAMTMDAETLNLWNITHLICDSETEVPTIDGLTHLQLPFSDDNNEDFTPAFTPAHVFMREAMSPGCRVLVKFWGRSRSAMLLAAHLMCYLDLSAEGAIDYIGKRCYRKIDKRLIPFDQLNEWRVPRLK